MFLKTKRLILRSLQVADAAPLAQLWADPEVTRYMGGPRDRAELQAQLEHDAQAEPIQFDLWPVIEQSSEQLIGHCGLLDKIVEDQAEIELIYVLAQSAWEQGYATEVALALKQYAFEQLKLPRLIALVAPENVASQRVALKAGFHYKKDVVRPGDHTLQLYVALKPH